MGWEDSGNGGGNWDHGRGVTQWRGAAVLREMGAQEAVSGRLVGTCTLELELVPDSALPLITCATLSSCPPPGHACVTGFLGELADWCAAVAAGQCHEGRRTHVQSRTFPCLSEPLHGDAPGDKRRRRGSPGLPKSSPGCKAADATAHRGRVLVAGGAPFAQGL